MITVYTGEEMPESFSKSLFLCGPSLRPGQEEEMDSWRNDAIQILKDKGYDGVIFCPETKDGKFEKDFDYDNQIEWEHKHLNVADCVVFWVPRDISLDKDGKLKLPAFTTNAEWGAWCDSGKVVFGAPSDYEKRKNKYLKYYADFYNVDGGTTLTETLDAALDALGDGVERTGGERFVPLFIWNTDSFQSWYSSQKKAGNRLDHAELLWSFRPRNKKFVFAWVLKVDIFIESENRYKNNEFVLSRTDISTVCLWHKPDNGSLEDIEVVIVKEFRSPANTDDGFIYELAGGSSVSKNEDPKEVAAHEVYEETNFHVKSERLKFHGARQLAGTFSAHRSHLFSAELDKEEIKWFKSQKGIVHGVIEDSERTFTEVFTIKELIKNNITDFTTLGQILAVIL